MAGPLDWLMGVRVVQQSLALFRKNALVAWRNRKATVLRLVAPFLFLLLALLIDVALQADRESGSAYTDVQTPEAKAIGPIPSCHEDLYIGDKPCSELLYSPDNVITRAIMGNVTTRNGVPITAISFATSDLVQRHLLAYPDTVLAAVQFVFNGEPATAANLAGFTLQTNSTVKWFKDEYMDPNFFAQIPVQAAVQREIARYYMAPQYQAAANNLQWDVGFKSFAHPAIATTSVLGMVLGPFVFAACMFSFVAQIGFLVGEKELGLRQALRTMGMTDFSYWLSWAVWELVLAFLTGHLITIFGLILQFNLFLKNSYGLLFFLFFLFQLAMSSLGMLVCTLINKSAVAVYIGFAIFLLGWIQQTVVIFGVPYSPDFYKTAGGAITVIFSLCPWCPLAKGFNDLGAATVSDASPGLSWSERTSYCNDIPNVNNQFSYDPREEYVSFKCVFPLSSIYRVYVALWLGYLFLAIYIDNVLPNEIGVRRPFYYPLLPSYWFPSRFVSHSLDSVDDSVGPQAGSMGDGKTDTDVMEEESKMRTLLERRTGRGGDKPEANAAIEVFGLKKVFPHNPCAAMGSCCFCCSSTKDERAFWAIKGSWFSIEQNQLFCLLGPNGAGKSTTINCLTGVLPSSNGEALVYGQAISSSGSMERIRSMMGVCPQFDVLWGELNSIEHLSIYGHVKGVYWRDVGKQAEQLLEKVKLTYAATQRSSAYSGGMKRRLSVAIALLGDPKVVYLDEPTTGMDPISRRYVWDIIQEAKVGRAIVLTTHSMEEADILGDRIAIMAKGKLRCIGTSLRLKQRFGSGYQVAVSVVPAMGGQLDASLLAQRAALVKAFFKDQLGLEPCEEGRVYIHFLVPREQDAQLSPFLKALEARSAELGVTDVQLSMTSLEEVFLNIAKEAEMEDARNSRHAKPVEVTLPDGTVMKVPLGEEYVVNPHTAQCYKIRWGTDESGNLCALDCKPVDAAHMQHAQQSGHQQGAATPPPGPGQMTSGLPVAQPVAVDGACDVMLPNGTVMRVPVDQRYVMDPRTSTPYEITWGKDARGGSVVVQCQQYVAPPAVQQQASRPGSGKAGGNRVHPDPREAGGAQQESLLRASSSFGIDQSGNV